MYRRSGGYSYSYFIPGPIGINLGMLKDPDKHLSLIHISFGLQLVAIIIIADRAAKSNCLVCIIFIQLKVV